MENMTTYCQLSWLIPEKFLNTFLKANLNTLHKVPSGAAAEKEQFCK